LSAPKDRAPNLAALGEFLARQPRDGDLVVLVTHYLTIAGKTGEGVSSGDGVLLALTGDGSYRVLGRIAFD
jgi:hypothetical protein